MYSFKLRQCSVISCTAVQWLGAAARFHPQFVGQLCCESVRVSITDRDENITYCEQLLWLARRSSFLSPHWFPVFLPMLPWPRATAWVQSAAWSELGGSGTSSSQCQHCVFFFKSNDSCLGHKCAQRVCVISVPWTQKLRRVIEEFGWSYSDSRKCCNCKKYLELYYQLNCEAATGAIFISSSLDSEAEKM